MLSKMSYVTCCIQLQYCLLVLVFVPTSILDVKKRFTLDLESLIQFVSFDSVNDRSTYQRLILNLLHVWKWLSAVISKCADFLHDFDPYNGIFSAQVERIVCLNKDTLLPFPLMS